MISGGNVLGELCLWKKSNKCVFVANLSSLNKSKIKLLIKIDAKIIRKSNIAIKL